MNAIAIMQGRLSPAEDSGLQFFPKDWPAEFPLAKEVGFSAITWFLDRDRPGLDPVNDVWGNPARLSEIDRVRAILPVHSIDCGRYPLFGKEAARSRADFRTLLPALAPRLSSGIVAIPLLEEDAPRVESEQQEAREALQDLVAVATPLGLRFALETEMFADALADFIDSFSTPAIGVCYDIGNCTSYGADGPADITRLGTRILEVHLKDRKVGSTQSVPLGTGDADFGACFQALKGIHYRGAFTLQALRGKDYLADAKSQLDFVKKKLQHAYEN